jgi:hypothetical protein
MGNFTGISVQNSVVEEKLLGVAVTDHRWVYSGMPGV